MMRARFVAPGGLALALLGLLFWAPHAESQGKTWQHLRTPKEGPPAAIGGYASGCLRGAARLPIDGVGYRVMKPSRLRMFGHPLLVERIVAWGRGVRAAGLGILLIGDLAQPRGGPAPNGHASHQTGLDVDVWYGSPETLDKTAFSRKQRELIEPHSVVDPASQRVNEYWTARMAAVLRLVADDASVARIFVHPVIKQALCAERQGSRAFLSKLRPWYGHDEHFHVRLACPADSPLCEPQPALAEGDGCEELALWLDPAKEEARQHDRARYRKRQGKAPALPAACEEVLK